MAVIMLTAVKLVDQWGTLERRLPTGWDDVELRLRTEQPEELGEAARVLGPMTVGKTGHELVFTVHRSGGPAGPDAARRLFGYLDDARIWCILAVDDLHAGEPEPEVPADMLTPGPAARSLAAGWDAALARLPVDWSDLLCELEVDSSDFLDRAALLCAPVNPARDGDRLAFTFRAARKGYGVSSGMARRCLERLDAEEIVGSVSVLRVLAGTDNVGTQGPVWYVGGKVL